MDIRLTGPTCACELDDQLRRELRGLLREVRVDAFLPTRRSLGPQAQPLGGTEDRVRLEVRGLQQDARRAVADLALLAAHDSGQRDGTVGVRDHQVVRFEVAVDPVERLQLLAGTRAADNDPAAGQLGEVERVQRVAEGEHRVVGDVDDVRDRPHPCRQQSCLEPDRRRPARDVAEEPADVTRAAFEVVDLHADLLVAVAAGIGAGLRSELEVVERGHLARDAVHRQQVGTVVERFELEHLVRERQHVAERRPGLEAVLEHHDAGVIDAELDLVLGEDHAVAHLSAYLAALEQEAVREHRAGQCDRNGRARAEVPRAADDLARVSLADVDVTELQPVGVRMLRRVEHTPDAEEPEVAVDVCDAPCLDPVDLAGRDDEAVGELARGDLDRDVLAQPAQRHAHR